MLLRIMLFVGTTYLIRCHLARIYLGGVDCFCPFISTGFAEQFVTRSMDNDDSDRTTWAGGSDTNGGLPSPPAMGGGDDQSYFSASQLPPATGDGEQFVPSKMGYLHIKNQVHVVRARHQ